ncbi:MAG: hypothetical protein FJY99_00150 [Candidatus Sericytochromatia bacterium]|nr:hypothetical protein [Candidatus Tanganyikabacteria bacterium]
MTAVARVTVALLLSLVVPAGPTAHPARAAETVSIEDTQGRLIWGKGSDARSLWSERNVWIEGTWLWSAHPVEAPSPIHLKDILVQLQSNILRLGELFVYQQLKDADKDTLTRRQEDVRLRLRRHFDEGAIRVVRYAGGPGAWQAQVAYDLEAFETALGFRAFSAPPRPAEPTRFEQVIRSEQWWNRAWDWAWLATMGLAVGAVVLLVDATTNRR